MKNLTLTLLLLLVTFSAQAQLAVTAQSTGSDDYRVEASIEVLEDVSVLGSYSTQNDLGKYTAVGVKYRNQLARVGDQMYPVFSVQGQYGLGLYDQPAAQDFLSDQKEFEFVFSYSVFGGLAVRNFDLGLSLNQHLGDNTEIWLSPSISYRF